MSLLEKATIITTPTAYSNGKLHSVKGGLIADFDVVRNSQATRVNKDGLIETMGANVPRLDYSAGGCPVLLTEPQRTNSITYSEDFSNVYWGKSNITVTSGFASPSGDLNAFKFVNNAVTSTHYLLRSGNSVTSGVDYTFSIFAKKGENNFITLMLQGSGWVGSSKSVSFNLLNGTFDYADSGLTYKSTLLNNGFYKIEVTNQTASTSANVRVYSSSTVYNVSSYLGDGTSGVYIYGAQFEQGSYSTSLINTSGSAVTRNGDRVYGAGDAATFNDSEGVLMAEIAREEGDTSATVVSLNDGSNSNLVAFYYFATNSVAIDILNSSTNISTSVAISNASNFNKIALKYKSGDVGLWINGIEVFTSTNTITLSGLNSLDFRYGSGSFPFYGKTSQIQYFDTALTDLELEKITSWASFSDMANALNYTIQ